MASQESATPAVVVEVVPTECAAYQAHPSAAAIAVSDVVVPPFASKYIVVKLHFKHKYNDLDAIT